MKMRKSLCIIILIVVCLFLLFHGKQEKSAVNVADNVNCRSARAMNIDAKIHNINDIINEITTMHSIVGYYSASIDLPEDRRVMIDFFIYQNENHYYGYINMTRKEQTLDVERAYKFDFYEVRQLAELHKEKDIIRAVCVKDFSESDYKKRFGFNEKGDLLYTLQINKDDLEVTWEEFFINGLEKQNLTIRDECLSVELLDEQDIEIFLCARGMEGKKLYRYNEDMSGLGDYMEVYFDKEKEKGAGFYCIQFEDGDKYCSGFDIAACGHVKWEDHRYDVIHQGENLLEKYDFEEEYNQNGQLTKLETKGIIEGWSGSPYEDTFVCIEFFYREDGTLKEKKCYYNDRVFGTTEHSQEYIYDEQERLQYRYAYVTHGCLRTFYIYEENNLEPIYSIELDFFGAGASTNYFLKYNEDAQ